MATNDVSEGGAVNKEDLDRKERLIKILQAEEKRYMPTWNAKTWH